MPAADSFHSGSSLQAMRAVSLAEKVSLRVDGRGVLCLQHMIKLEANQGKKTFVEVYCLPNEDDIADYS